MRIYLGHLRAGDYQKELYEPIRASSLNNKHAFILPHELSSGSFNSKQGLKQCDLMLAEISTQSISLGIEIGWAHLYGLPVVFMYKPGSKVNNSLKVISSDFLEYDSSEKLITGLEMLLPRLEREMVDKRN